MLSAAMRCAVLTYAYAAIAMCETDLRVCCYAMCGTDLRVCYYAMCGTDLSVCCYHRSRRTGAAAPGPPPSGTPSDPFPT
eukprot:2771062-Rhodomonas_salina.1